MAATAAPAVTGAWHGRLAARFARDSQRTTLARAAVCMPLALQRAFYPEGPGCCHVLLLHPPGGMVDGDRLDIDLRLDAQAEALVSTPSAAKWYRARDGAQQTVVAQVGRDAHLEWLPLETIVFDGARVRQSLRVELAPGASWSGWEITRFGRSARGEEFARGSWRSATEVWRTDGAPLWIDRQQLSGGSALLRDAYGLAGRAVAATFAWIGQTAPVELVDAVRARWARAAYGGEVGITRQAEGLVCRYRGDSTSAARAWFVDAWEEIRRHARGRPACPPRVWNI